MTAGGAPASAVLGLGATQIIGYGTLYYSFAILAPAIAAEFGIGVEWTFGALSVALFLGSLLAPTAGRMADRLGAGRVMGWGSLAAAVSLALAALAPNAWTLAGALVAMELAACFVLYSTAFVALVQASGAGAQRSIVQLTLIAGFASTIFWPFTTWLHGWLGWREVFFVFAGLNLLVCLPVHVGLLRAGRRRGVMPAPAVASPGEGGAAGGSERAVFGLLLGGFALTGFVLSAVLLHMVPLLAALGLGTAGVLVAALFGPAQVAARLVNMVFGGRLRQAVLAVIAAGLLSAGLVMLIGGAPAVAAIAGFTITFGLGSGLMSIVSGTLPLEAFGRARYGYHVGWMSAARQFSAAFAPFVLAVALARAGVATSLAMLLVAALAGVACFSAVGWRRRGQAPAG